MSAFEFIRAFSRQISEWQENVFADLEFERIPPVRKCQSLAALRANHYRSFMPLVNGKKGDCHYDDYNDREIHRLVVCFVSRVR